jgi:hypothetical protein
VLLLDGHIRLFVALRIRCGDLPPVRVEVVIEATQHRVFSFFVVSFFAFLILVRVVVVRSYHHSVSWYGREGFRTVAARARAFRRRDVTRIPAQCRGRQPKLPALCRVRGGRVKRHLPATVAETPR